MIALWFIIMGIFWTVDTKPLMKKLSFEGCKQDSWRVTDISLEPDGDKIHVVADVGYDEKITDKLHQIKLTLLDCGKDYRCRNHTEAIVNDVDCLSKNVTELDREACDVAKTLAEWELDTGEISQESKSNKTSVATDREKVCVHYDTKLIDFNAAVGSANLQEILRGHNFRKLDTFARSPEPCKFCNCHLDKKTRAFYPVTPQPLRKNFWSLD